MRWGREEISLEGGSFSIWLLAFRSRVAREMVEMSVVRARSLCFSGERLMVLEVGCGLDIVVGL
jgi:hypothetical protein